MKLYLAFNPILADLKDVLAMLPQKPPETLENASCAVLLYQGGSWVAPSHRIKWRAFKDAVANNYGKDLHLYEWTNDGPVLVSRGDFE